MTDETPMRERIARAIDPKAFAEYERSPETSIMHSYYTEQMTNALAKADAVLDAMREPSEQVVICAAKAVRDFYTEDGPYPRTKAMWKAAIDAAKEGK